MNSLINWNLEASPLKQIKGAGDNITKKMVHVVPEDKTKAQWSNIGNQNFLLHSRHQYRYFSPIVRRMHEYANHLTFFRFPE